MSTLALFAAFLLTAPHPQVFAGLIAVTVGRGVYHATVYVVDEVDSSEGG